MPRAVWWTCAKITSQELTVSACNHDRCPWECCMWLLLAHEPGQSFNAWHSLQYANRYLLAQIGTPMQPRVIYIGSESHLVFAWGFFNHNPSNQSSRNWVGSNKITRWLHACWIYVRMTPFNFAWCQLLYFCLSCLHAWIINTSHDVEMLSACLTIMSHHNSVIKRSSPLVGFIESDLFNRQADSRFDWAPSCYSLFQSFPVLRIQRLRIYTPGLGLEYMDSASRLPTARHSDVSSHNFWWFFPFYSGS